MKRSPLAPRPSERDGMIMKLVVGVVGIVFILFLVTSVAAQIGGLSQAVAPQTATTQYDSGDPTPEEQLVLEYINRARANPTAEGTRLGINMTESLCDLSGVGVRPPLAMNKILLQVADYHSWDMYTNNYFDHNDLSGHDLGQRMTDAGYSWWTWGENIAVGSGGYSATNMEDDLMVDSSTSCRLHRVNLFDNDFKEVGVGYYVGATPNPSGWSNFLSQDFGSTSVGPFLVGVVYNDADGDNFYDIGEGISGVTITPSTGTYYAASSTSGGYAFPIATSGTITVTASRSGLGSISKTVSLTGANIKLDFTLQDYSTFMTTTSTSETQATTSTSETQTATSTSEAQTATSTSEAQTATSTSEAQTATSTSETQTTTVGTFVTSPTSITSIVTTAEITTNVALSLPLSPPRCVIATATFGSALAPEVVYMRYVRDQLIGSTPSGRTLIEAFNTFYYTWSPAVAEVIAGNGLLRAFFRIILLPLVGIVHVSAMIFRTVALMTGQTDRASVFAFVGAAVMTISVYIALPIAAVAKAKQTIRGLLARFHRSGP
jgi:hypothetical protein